MEAPRRLEPNRATNPTKLPGTHFVGCERLTQVHAVSGVLRPVPVVQIDPKAPRHVLDEGRLLILDCDLSQFLCDRIPLRNMCLLMLVTAKSLPNEAQNVLPGELEHPRMSLSDTGVWVTTDCNEPNAFVRPKCLSDPIELLSSGADGLRLETAYRS